MRGLRIGRRKACAMPLTVMAQARTSRPCMAGGMASAWMGVGRVKPISRTPRRRSGCSPNWEKGKGILRCRFRLFVVLGTEGCRQDYVRRRPRRPPGERAEGHSPAAHANRYDAAMKRPLLLLGACLAALGCAKPPASPAAATPVPSPAATPQAAWVPDLGDLMLQQQMRHAKLWLAGDAG